MGNIAHGDHGVPVLFQVAHLVIAGNVGGGEYTHHAGQGFRLLGMDGKDPGTGILGTDGAAVDHAVQVNIVGVLACAGDLLLHVHPGHSLAQRPVTGFPGDLAVPEQLRRQQNGVDDLHIAGAAADVIADGKSSLFPGRIRIHIQQSLGTHHHTGDAEAALDGAGVTERVCINFLFKVCQALHRDDGLSLQLVGLGNAGPGGLAVNKDGAGAAGALAAAVFHAGKVQFIPKAADQLLILLDSHGLAVYGKCCHE